MEDCRSNSPEKSVGDADYHTTTQVPKGQRIAPKRKGIAPIQEGRDKPKFRAFWRSGVPTYLLFECASGYALFHAHDYDDIEWNFESAEEYICRFNTVMLEAFYPFESTADALYQMNAISGSSVTEQLESFLQKYLPEPSAGPNYFLNVFDPNLAHNIFAKTRISVQCGIVHADVMRGLRLNIDKLINIKRGDLEKAQHDLALLYSKQRSTSTYEGNSIKASSSSFLEAVVVPHKFEGVFKVMGLGEDTICTKSLVPSEGFCDEELISVQNKDGTQVQYRIWNPSKSKFAAAILSGVKNIWVKPGSRVLYFGDVCETEVSHLSDLVGHDGLVYVVGLSDAFVNMAEKRTNVIPICERFCHSWKYRMVVGIVDVLFVSLAHPRESRSICLNMRLFLRTGGHYIISTQASYIDSTRQDENLYACLGKHEAREYKPIEHVMLKQFEGGYAIAVGVFRMPNSQHTNF